MKDPFISLLWLIQKVLALRFFTIQSLLLYVKFTHLKDSLKQQRPLPTLAINVNSLLH